MGPGHQLQRMQNASEYHNTVVENLLVLTCTRDASLKIASEERGHNLNSIGPKPLVNALGEGLSRSVKLLNVANREDANRFQTNAERLWTGHNRIAQFIEECEAREIDWGNRLCEHIQSRPSANFNHDFKCIWDDSLERSREIMLDSTSDRRVNLVDHLSGAARREFQATASDRETILQGFFVWGTYLGPIEREELKFGEWAARRVERAADHALSFFND